MKLSLVTTLLCLTSVSLCAIEFGNYRRATPNFSPPTIWEDISLWSANENANGPAPANYPGSTATGGDVALITHGVGNMLAAGTVTLGGLIVNPTAPLTVASVAGRVRTTILNLVVSALTFRRPPPNTLAGNVSVNLFMRAPGDPGAGAFSFNSGVPGVSAELLVGQTLDNQTIVLGRRGTPIFVQSPLAIGVFFPIPIPVPGFGSRGQIRENFNRGDFRVFGIRASTYLDIQGLLIGSEVPIEINGNDFVEVNIGGGSLGISRWTINGGTVILDTPPSPPPGDTFNPSIRSDVTVNEGGILTTTRSGQFTDNVTITVNRGGIVSLANTSHDLRALQVNGGRYVAGNITFHPLSAPEPTGLPPPIITVMDEGHVTIDQIFVGPTLIEEIIPVVIEVNGSQLDGNLISVQSDLVIQLNNGGILGADDKSLNLDNPDDNDVLIQVNSSDTEFFGPDGTIINVHDDTPVLVDGIGTTLLISGNNDLILMASEGADLEILIGDSPTDSATFHQETIHNHHGDIIGGHGDLIIRTLDGNVGTLINNGIIQPGDTRRPGTFTVEAHLEQKSDATAVFTLEHRNNSQLIVNKGHVNLDGALVFTGCQIEIPVGCERILIDNRCGEGIRGNFRCFVDRLSDNVMGNPHLSADGMTYLLGIAASPQAGIGGAIQTLNFGVTQETLIAAERTWEIRPWPASTSEALTASNGQIEAGRFWEKPSNHPATIYIAPLGNWGTIKRNGTQRGLDFNSVGGLIGGDYAFERAGVGAFIGYDRIKGTVDESYGNFRVQSLFGQAYGTFVLTPDRNLFLDLTLGGMRNWFTFNRQTSCTIARGKPNGWTYDGYAGLGYNLTVKKEWRLTPIVGIQYIRSKIDDFCETDAGVENLCVDDFKKHFLRSWLGATFGGKLERNRVIWMPQIHVYWQHEFTDLSRCLAVANPCLNTCKNLGIATSDRNYGIMGADLSVIFGNNYNWIVTGAYDYFLSRKAKVNNMYGKLGYNF